MEENIDKEDYVKFFTSRGWTLFSSLVQELILCEESKMNRMFQEAVNEKSLQELNFCLGKKKAYQTILSCREELCGEEEENSPESQA